MAASFIALFVIYALRYKKAPPNKAMVVYGRKAPGGVGYIVITGGGKFIVPIIERYEYLSLGPYNVTFELDDATTSRKEKLRINIASILRTPTDKLILANAATYLLGKSEGETIAFARTILEGSIKRVSGSASFDEIESDKEAYREQIVKVANFELHEIGLDTVSLNINELKIRS